MAESVDALVSNTSGATRAGSTPALGTKVPMCGEKDALVSMKARCCKTTTYSTFSFYNTKVFLSKFSPHFPTDANMMQLNSRFRGDFPYFYIWAEVNGTTIALL